MPNILPENLVIHRSPNLWDQSIGPQVSSHWVVCTLEALTTTLAFIRSDQPVFNTTAFRRCSPCYPTQAVAGAIVSHIRNPYLTFQAEFTIFTDASTQGWGAHMGDSQIAGVWTRSESELQINVLELRAVILGLHHWATVLQGRHVLMATDNTGLPNSRPVVSADPAHHDRVESPPRSRESDIQTVGNSSSGHVCHSPQHASSPVHVSSSGASSTGDRCLVTGLAGEVDVGYMFPPFSPAQQSHSEAQDHPDGRGDTHHPLVAVTTVVSTPATTECGSPTILSVPQRPVVITGLYLKWQVIPSARMEALMQHYQAAGFSRKVSKLAAAPTCRRPTIECTTTGGYASLTGPQGEDLIHLVAQLLK